MVCLGFGFRVSGFGFWDFGCWFEVGLLLVESFSLATISISQLTPSSTTQPHLPTAAPESLLLQPTMLASCARVSSWEPFAFRLLRATAVMIRPAQMADEIEFSTAMQKHASCRADASGVTWMNVVVHAAPCESIVQSLASLPSSSPSPSSSPAPPPPSSSASSLWICCCCCYISDCALVCAFFSGQGSNPLFIDVITGSSCASAPLHTATAIMTNNVIGCSYTQGIVAATDSYSLFIYR